MDIEDIILARALKFVTLANKALKRAGEEGEAQFSPTLLKIATSVEARGGTFVVSYRAVFGPFMVHHSLSSLESALDALEEVINVYGV